MPHLIIDYAEGLAGEAEIESLLDALHAAAAATGLFDESHIKLRAFPVRHYRIAGGREPFVHVEARLHNGRDGEQKRRLSAALLEAVMAQPWLACLVTVEVVDMDKSSYAKSR